MLHLLRQHSPEETPAAYAEAVSRLASVRHAMRLVEPFGAGPASDVDDEHVASAWDEALLIERQDGREPHAAASQALADEIRRELRDVAGIVLR